MRDCIIKKYFEKEWLEMEAIILAGGLGTRLSEVVPNLPKPMAPINGKPFLEILLRTLQQKGFTSFILSVGYLSEKIVTHFGENFMGVPIKYVPEKNPLGTGGGIREAIKRVVEDRVYIFNGDTFVDFNVEETEELWRTAHSPIIIGSKVKDVSRYGGIATDGKKIFGFFEKGLFGSGIINAGYYVMPKVIVSRFPNEHSFSFEKDFLSHDIDKGEYYLYIAKGKFIDIGVPQDYSRAQAELANI